MTTARTTPSTSTEPSIGDLQLLSGSWRLSLEAANRAPNTISIYLSGFELFRRFLVDRGMPTAVASLHREHVEAFQKWMLDEGYRPASVRNRHQALQAFFKWALEEGEITASPMMNIRPPQVPEAPPPVLSEDDVAALLGTCEGKALEDRRDAAIIRIFYSVGLRLSELANLTVDDLDLRERTMKVLGKGRRPREVGYGMKVAQAVDRYLRVRRTHPYAELPDLWLARKGPLTGSGVRQMLERRGDLVGIEGLHPHLLRHTWAHFAMSDERRTETDIMTTAGWRSPRMLSRYGASKAQERAQEAQRKFDHGDRL